MNTSKTALTKEQYDKLTSLKCAVAYNMYGGYCIPASSQHRPAVQTIIKNDVWEPGTIQFMMANCMAGDIVHAGAYFGDFLPALSQGAAPGAKIWAFEPNHENYRCAKITLELNDISNVVLTHSGLGTGKNDLQMKTVDDDGRALGGASYIIGSDTSGLTGLEKISIVSVDETVSSDRTVSIIQLDVEGHEKAALMGSLQTIKRNLPIILLEVLPHSTLLSDPWFAENILQLGYKKIDEIHGNSIFKC